MVLYRKSQTNIGRHTHITYSKTISDLPQNELVNTLRCLFAHSYAFPTCANVHARPNLSCQSAPELQTLNPYSNCRQSSDPYREHHSLETESND